MASSKTMRFFAVLNRDGGALRTADLDAVSAKLREVLEGAGHRVETHVVAGAEIDETLDRAAASRADVVLVGGGDGTVSAAAARLMGRKKALAVLPAGTMNLFARGLGIPLALDAAFAAFADGEVKKVDIATANGRPFVHQFSIGLHARMVQLRDKMEFASRLGKIRASARAAWNTIAEAPAIKVGLQLGDRAIAASATAVGVTNNLFGEGHLPYADKPDGGVLGIYVTVARRRGEIIRFLWGMARGRWRHNDQVDFYEAERVVLTVESRRRRLSAAIDGELCPLDRETEIRIHPGALRVLVPASAAPAKAA